MGWLKNVDEYFSGFKDNVQVAGVYLIIENIIASLKDHPERKFIYVEIAFFER